MSNHDTHQRQRGKPIAQAQKSHEQVPVTLDEIGLDTPPDPSAPASSPVEGSGLSSRIRLPDGPGGPPHRRPDRDDQKAATRAAIESAIETLASVDGPDGYPSAERLVKVGKGTFSRSRVFEHLDLADAAVDAWHERERASGRATRRRRKRRGVVPVREEGQSLGDNDAIAANVKLDAQLAHAVKVAKDASRRADRLASENKELGRKLARLGKGIHDEVWPERTLETATFPGDPLDKGEDADLDHQRELSANDDDR